MIKGVFRRAEKPLSKVIFQAIREMGKYYSRLELAYAKLEKRSRSLLDTCSFCLKKGLKARANIYAEEVSEIRKIMSLVQSTQLAVERAILRLETLKAVSPTLGELKGVLGDVKNALLLIANVMPSITPEINRLNNAINEILDATQLNMQPEPLLTKSESTEAILQEAAMIAEQELQWRIPEPPIETKIPKPERPSKPLAALVVDGSEVYLDEGRSEIKKDSSLVDLEKFKPLSEELVMDYIERNNGKINIAECAMELNMPTTEVSRIIESLRREGKIKVKQ